jgi:hypothetical protein
MKPKASKQFSGCHRFCHWARLALLAFVLSLWGCVPAGTESGSVEVLWTGSNSARIERRNGYDKYLYPISPEGFFHRAKFLRSEYWFTTKSASRRLSFLKEARGYDKNMFPDRNFIKEDLGDETDRRWAQIAAHITSRSRADMYLKIFDEDEVLGTITVKDCIRDFQFDQDLAAHYSLMFDPKFNRIRFKNATGVGYIDLKDRSVNYEEPKAPQPQEGDNQINCRIHAALSY